MNFVLILRYHRRNYCSFIFTTKVENLTTWPAGWPAHSTWAKASISNLQGGRHRFPGLRDYSVHVPGSSGPDPAPSTMNSTVVNQ
jgi:hypothetical protein